MAGIVSMVTGSETKHVCLERRAHGMTYSVLSSICYLMLCRLAFSGCHVILFVMSCTDSDSGSVNRILYSINQTTVSVGSTH